MSNPFTRWHNGETSNRNSEGTSAEHLSSDTLVSGEAIGRDSKRETVYLTPQQIKERMSDEDRAVITPWPEPEQRLPKVPSAVGMQWTGMVGYQPSTPGPTQTQPWALASTTNVHAMYARPPSMECEDSRTSSLYDPRTLPRLQTQLLFPPPPARSTSSLHSSKPSTGSAYSACESPATSIRSGRKSTKPSISSIFRSTSRAPSTPPPVSPTETTGFSLATHASLSASYAGSDISVSVSVAGSSIAPESIATPRPRGRRRPTTSASEQAFSPETPHSSRSSPRSSTASPNTGVGHKSSMFGRLKQKMSNTSLRPVRSQTNGGEPIPPLPVRSNGSSQASLAGTSGPKTPTNASFSGKPRSSVTNDGKSRSIKSRPKKYSRSEPAFAEEEDPEFKTTTYFDHVDFDNLNPEEFLTFGAVSEQPARSSVDTVAGADATDEFLGRLSTTTGSSEPQRRPSIVPEPSLVEDMDWEVPDSWAVMTDEAMAREDGLESEPDQSEEEEDVDSIAIEHVENEQAYAERDDWFAKIEDKYVLRVYRPNGTWHVVECPLTATASDIRQRIVQRFGLENEGMIGRFRFFIVEKGQERMLLKKEKPLVMLRRRLLAAGYTTRDKIKAQGGRELQYLCRFVLQTSDLHGLAQEYDGMFDHLQGRVKLENMNLQTIPAQLHKIAIHLVDLSLRGNPIMDLPRDFCMATTQLQSLNLSRTALRTIPAAISFCRRLQFLDLSYNRIKTLQMVNGGLQNLRHLKTLYLHVNLLTDLTGTIGCLPIQDLRVDMNRLECLPTAVCDLSLLKRLDISHNAITALPPSIGKLTQLESLTAVDNRLQSLPGELRYLACLKALVVSWNQLQDISVISQLVALERFVASHNNIVNITMPFPPRLQTLILDSNPFTKLNPFKSVIGTIGIRQLNLSKLKLSTLSFDFEIFPDLIELSLDDSRIGELPPSVTKLRRLVKLSACNASLKHLPDAVGDMESLQELIVHSNDLTAIPGTIWMCPSLRLLNASSNRVLEFPEAPAGANAPLARSLKALYLADNRLGHSVFFRVSMLRHLRHLNLSHNPLRNIPEDTLRLLKYLEVLSLSKTDIMAFRSEFLPPWGTMRRLYLNSNSLHDLPSALHKYPHLSVLDVGHNQLRYNIHNFRYDYQWIWNQELRMLNLSGNKMFTIDKPQPGQAKDRVNAADFRTLTGLESLGLMDVTLSEAVYLPEETARCRIRTTASSLNGMRYDVSEALGENLMGSFDMVVPKYRGHDDECLFGIFTREEPSNPSNPGTDDLTEYLNPLTRYLASHFPLAFEQELAYTEKLPELGDVTDALRRAFLKLNKDFYDSIVNGTGLALPMNAGLAPPCGNASVVHPELRFGACACVAYIKGNTLYIANAGNVEAILGRPNECEVLTTVHTPMDAVEKERITKAETLVTPQGILDGELAVSRAFGFFAKSPIIHPAPSITKLTLSRDEQFAIIGNAELWRYVKKDAARKVVQKQYSSHARMSAAQDLRDLALAYGATGNVQVMVVMLSDRFLSQAELDKARRQAGSLLLRDNSAEKGPEGMVVLVFTDIRNSTMLWERSEGPMHRCLEIHNSCMRRVARLCGAYEVKTEGDAFVLAFSSLLSAVRFCLQAQVELLKEEWLPELLACDDGRAEYDDNGKLIEKGLSVRMGIHIGEPHCQIDPTTNRMDYFGPVVNRAARVSSAAKGGHIMISSDVRRALQPYLDELAATADASANKPNGHILQLSSDDMIHLERIRDLQPILINVGITELKGIEQPENLSLLFPKDLVGRRFLKKRQATNATATRPDTDPYGLGVTRETLVSLAMLCRRLEAIDSGRIFRLLNEAAQDGSELPKEAGAGSIYGLEEELLSRLGYSGPIQVDRVLVTLVDRIEHYISRLRLRNAFDQHEVRRVMYDVGGFDPQELVNLFRDTTAQL